MLHGLGGPLDYDIFQVDVFFFPTQHVNKKHLLSHIKKTHKSVLNCYDYHRCKIETLLLYNYQSSGSCQKIFLVFFKDIPLKQYDGLS